MAFTTVCPNFDGLQQDFLQSIRSRSQHLCFRLRSQSIFSGSFPGRFFHGHHNLRILSGQVDNHLVLFANRGENNFPDGFLAEFLYYPTALTPFERVKVERYLAHKWDLSYAKPRVDELFSIDENGTLRTLTGLDYEIDANHSVRIRATDEGNATLDQDFLVTVTNVVEDLDSDGIEDHYDPDDDGDGFSDLVETAYGSDPRNANSVANVLPTSLSLVQAVGMKIAPVLLKLVSFPPSTPTTTPFFPLV